MFGNFLSIVGHIVAIYGHGKMISTYSIALLLPIYGGGVAIFFRYFLALGKAIL